MEAAHTKPSKAAGTSDNTARKQEQPRLPSGEPAIATAQEKTSQSQDTPKPAGKSRSRMIVLCLLAVALCSGAWYGYKWWTYSRFMIETDDAYVQADISILGIKVSGYIKSVPVQNGDSVKTGDILVTLDDTDYRTALDIAKARYSTQIAAIDRIDHQIMAQEASVKMAEAGVSSAHAIIASAKAGATSADAELVRSTAAYERANTLAAQNFSSKAALDQATSDKDRAEAAASSALAAIESANATMSSALAAKIAAQANLNVVKAQKKEAEQTLKELSAEVTKVQNDIDATVIRAPVDGVVGNRAVHPGQYVSPGSRLMALVPLHSIYISANFKETQLDLLVSGQKARISLDSLPDSNFEGIVSKFSPASGSVFSLLPPENATGNFTKITQRIPVRINVPATLAATGKLRPGMSVVVSVDSRTGR